MKIFGLVECRSVTRHRVQLGDPSKDVYEYTAYSFLGHQDFDILQYGAFGHGSDRAAFISRDADLLELGGQYRVSLSDEPPGCAMVCTTGAVNGLPTADLKALDHNDEGYWTSTWISVKTKADLSVGKTYYLAVLEG